MSQLVYIVLLLPEVVSAVIESKQHSVAVTKTTVLRYRGGVFLRNDFHFPDVYRSINIGSRRGSSKFCTRPSVVYNSINIGKIKFIAYIYIHFYAELDEKYCKKAKIESTKRLHAIFLLTAERRY